MILDRIREIRQIVDEQDVEVVEVRLDYWSWQELYREAEENLRYAGRADEENNWSGTETEAYGLKVCIDHSLEKGHANIIFAATPKFKILPASSLSDDEREALRKQFLRDCGHDPEGDL